MTEYNEEDYLMISGIQHFSFCKRQWALIHIEQSWEDNRLTAEGQLMHEKAHDPFFSEKRKNVITTCGISISSKSLGISGVCDVVEFIKDPNGINISGREGLWLPRPVEYKHGQVKSDDCDRLQLCAQAVCLEEMLLCKIEQACIYYGQTKHREYVDLNEDLRERLDKTVLEMHKYFNERHTPKVKPSKSCKSCSLMNLCIPELNKNASVSEYIENSLKECGKNA